MHESANPSIQCSVTSCAHHCPGQNYCSLKEIRVGCDSPNVGKCDQTECASFKLGDHGTSCCN